MDAQGDDVQKLPCAEKVAFDTKKEAAAAGSAAEWQYGGSLKAYQCQYCRLWHLSSNFGD
jgi:hypothetical protein